MTSSSESFALNSLSCHVVLNSCCFFGRQPACACRLVKATAVGFASVATQRGFDMSKTTEWCCSPLLVLSRVEGSKQSRGNNLYEPSFVVPNNPLSVHSPNPLNGFPTSRLGAIGTYCSLQRDVFINHVKP